MTVRDQHATVPITGEFPWPEPWRHTRAALPRSEFWDFRTASWRSRGPVPRPRSGD